MNRQGKTIAFHLLGWVLFFALIISFVSYSPEASLLPGLFTPSFLLFCFVYMALFYFNTQVLFPEFYLQKKFLLYAGIVLLLFLGVYFLKPFERLIMLQHRPRREFRQPPPGNRFPPPDHERRRPNDRQGGPPRNLDIVSIILFLSTLSLGTALQVLREWRNSERRVLQAERDKVGAELSFLKAQVNPHFLFNTLNNIYALAVAKSDKTPDAVMKLSHILRYVTDDAGQDVVPLQSEIDCIINYIELQKLRLTSKADVLFNVRGTVHNKAIAPLLLMTFIENAFKYGISNHQPCTIQIEISAGEKSVTLFCQNRILVQSPEEERTGVGINNAKKRLNYLYPNKYLLNIDTEKDHFTVHLTIDM